MVRATFLAILFLCGALSGLAAELDEQQLDQWHQWRGPLASGFAPTGNPPIEWGEDKNIKWKVELPGQGTASPIIWENKIFILTAIKTDRQAEPAADAAGEQPADAPSEASEKARARLRGRLGGGKPTNYFQFVVLCLDRATGKTLWQQVVREELPHEGHHGDHGYASGSPTTDGEFLYASFGSRGIYCLTLDGEVRWERDFGDMRTRNGFGEGTSPTLVGDTLIVNWDHEAEDFIAALDAKTGETRWQVDRDEPTGWSTPLAVPHDGKMQIVVNGTNRARGYDLAGGELLWECGGQTTNAIPSPVTADGVVYCVSGFRGSAAVAISLDARGDLTETDNQVWTHSGGTPYVPSPLLYGDLLYLNKSNDAILTVLNAKTGEVLIEKERLPGLKGIYASPVGAAGRVYYIGRNGASVVLKHGTTFEILAENTLDDPIDSSPAIVGQEMYLRGKEHLYCIAEPQAR